ncbi:MAG: hypothetical protein J5814_04560 [Bacteroidaceae bacterium]|nr:hypothetical protein [Bacteroidaceae bacterium]
MKEHVNLHDGTNNFAKEKIPKVLPTRQKEADLAMRAKSAQKKERKTGLTLSALFRRCG